MLLVHYCVAVILLQCCEKVSLVSSVTAKTFGIFLSFIIWSVCFTCGCMWCLCVSSVKNATVDLAIDTVSFFGGDVVEHL